MIMCVWLPPTAWEEAYNTHKYPIYLYFGRWTRAEGFQESFTMRA